MKLILNEIVRSSKTKIDPPLDVLPTSGVGDANDAVGEPIHYKTSILQSINILEKAALHVDKSLKRVDNLSDYVALLREHVSELTREQCAAYVDAYNKARVGADACTAEEYAAFIALFFEMLQSFERQERRNRGLSSSSTQRAVDVDANDAIIDASADDAQRRTHRRKRVDKKTRQQAAASTDDNDAPPTRANASPPSSDVEMQPLKRKAAAK